MSSRLPRAQLAVAGLSVLGGLIMTFGAFLILPSGDDWWTSIPIKELHWKTLAPGRFWRPFEQLVRAASGVCVDLYPWLAHLVAAFGHLGSALALWRLLARQGVAPLRTQLALLLFLVHPAVCGAVWSVDGGTQTVSTFFALLATDLASRDKHFGALRQVAFSTLFFLALLWKESAAGAFLVAASFCQLRFNAPRLTLRVLLAGSATLAFYFGLRHFLAVEEMLREGRYALGIRPLVMVRNAAMLGTVALVPVDTVSLFGGAGVLRAFTPTLLSLPLLLFFAREAVRCDLRRSSVALLATSGSMSPHLLLENVSELYAHPTVATLALFSPSLLPALDGVVRKAVGLMLASYLFAGLLCGWSKWSHMHAAGREAEQRGWKLKEEISEAPARLCSVLISSGAKQYSVFKAASAEASGFGRSVLPLWGWPSVEWQLVSERSQCAPSSDWVLVFDAGALLAHGPADALPGELYEE